MIVSPRILPTFVQQDGRLLSSEYDVELIAMSGLASIGRLKSAVRNAGALFLWFLGRHAIPAILFAHLRRIPVVAVIGGFEVAWEEDIQYGIQPGSARDRLLGWMLRQMRAIVTVSRFSHNLAVGRFPTLSDRMILIHNAVDESVFSPSPTASRSGVLCVATLSADSIKVKNLGLYRQLAIATPGTSFTLVGPAIDSEAKRYVSSLPKNVQWMGQLSDDSLVDAYRKASVYFLASHHESFSLALAEAMSCGCIPVISPNGALPEVGGADARIVQNLSIESCQEAIADGLTATEVERIRVREHIAKNFGTKLRRAGLSRLFAKILHP